MKTTKVAKKEELVRDWYVVKVENIALTIPDLAVTGDADASEALPEAPGGSETVLLVEDDGLVLEVGAGGSPHPRSSIIVWPWSGRSSNCQSGLPSARRRSCSSNRTRTTAGMSTEPAR